VPLSIGVDAYNLAADHRGMGRYVRRILNDWRSEPDLNVTLIVKNQSDASALQQEFPFAIATTSKNQDAVWFPWNSMRFAPNAHSVLTLHDAFAFTLPHRNWIARWREQSPIRNGIKHANALASNSHWTAEEAARVFNIDKTRFTVIPPVPDEFWKPVESAAQDPYILVVAGPDERKNLQTLFTAFERAFPEGSVTLKVAGTLNEDDEHALSVARFRHERLKPTDEELRALYSGALALAIPSTYEGYGIMAVEAMSCGAPVIASNASALPESCDNAALLVPPKDIQAWSHALARIVSDADLRNTLRAQSLERAERIDRKSPARETLKLLTPK
jgi:glycosyltransferase involved in cell wall biosynthesis